MRKKNEVGLLEITSYALTLLALWVVMRNDLLAALFSGLLVYSLVHLVTPLLGRKISSRRARMVAVATLAIVTVTALTAAIWGGVAFFRSDAGNAQVLLHRIADMLDSSRSQLPDWLREYLPSDVESLKEMLTNWLRGHAAEAKMMGEAAGRTAAHLLIGMIIGALVALSETTYEHSRLPLASVLGDRVLSLSEAFRRIVFAQFRIAGINTVFTGIYILIVLPLAGVHLPLSKSMIAITFFAGLLPIVGNLISNSILVVVALSHSFQTAIASLVFLVVIHKLEYFLNAKIIGAHIQARIWELLIAMLVMESIFGMPGVVAAPVFYAYLKLELMQRELV
jgi:predicted PurR-regulated permease PerM